MGARFELLDISQAAQKKKSLKNRTDRCVWISEDHKAEVDPALLPLALARQRNDLLIPESSEGQEQRRQSKMN